MGVPCGGAEDDQLAAGAAMVVSGYRIGMLASGAGALYLASVLPWSMVYVIMGAGILVGMATILAMPEPLAGTAPATGDRPEGGGRAGRRPAAERLAAWFARAFVGPFSEFMARRGWVAFLLFAVLYKLGDSMAGHMATPLYVDLGFDKVEVANYAKVLGTAATFGGLFVGGALMRGLGLGPTLWIAGIAQALSNLTFAALALVGHQDWMLATAIGVENLTGGVGTAALVAYFSLLCNVQFTATQFALLSAFASAARTFLTAPTGWLVEDLGWVHYFVVTTLAAAPGLAPYNASKAAVEHFANALRLEVAHRGVDVGSAHMSWIDTPLVRDTKDDLSTFGEMLSRLPYPLNQTTSVEQCGQVFVAGIEGRKRHINCPGRVGVLRWLKPVLSTMVGESRIRGFVPDLLPRMDAEVARLGRSMGSRTKSVEER